MSRMGRVRTLSICRWVCRRSSSFCLCFVFQPLSRHPNRQQRTQTSKYLHKINYQCKGFRVECVISREPLSGSIRVVAQIFPQQFLWFLCARMNRLTVELESSERMQRHPHESECAAEASRRVKAIKQSVHKYLGKWQKLFFCLFTSNPSVKCRKLTMSSLVHCLFRVCAIVACFHLMSTRVQTNCIPNYFVQLSWGADRSHKTSADATDERKLMSLPLKAIRLTFVREQT